MNKQKFLKELEKRLSILSESERKDTINEYRDIIEEKVKHGKTEDEAVKEFGTVEELSKEILDAYKINPEYQSKRSDAGDKAKEFVETTEDFIKKGAQKLSEVTDEVVDSFKKSEIEFTTEKVFEIVIKIILVLLALAVLKIPFYIIGELGSHIFSWSFAPVSWFSNFFWKFLIEVIYLVVCIFIIITLVSKYTKGSKSIQKTNGKREEPKKKNTIKTEEVIRTESKKKETVKNDTVGSFLLTLVKIWTCVFVLIPVWIILICLGIGISFIIYFLVKGVEMYGVLILLLGLFGMGCEFANIVYRLLFTRKKIYPFSFIINIILIIVGMFMTFDYFSDFTYHDRLPENQYHITSTTYEEHITKETRISGNVEYIIDDTLEDGKVTIEATYYDEYVSITKTITNTEEPTIYFTTTSNQHSFNWKRDISDRLIQQLKEKEFYNFDDLKYVKLKVYTNRKTKDLLK